MAKEVTYNRSVFIEGSTGDFIGWCSRENKPQNICSFINFCIDHNIITEATINKFAVLKEFQRLHPQNPNNKRQTVTQISINVELTESRVWTILKDETFRFRNKKK